MNKRGAMAIMIIIALLILFLVGFFVAIKSQMVPEVTEDDYSGYEAKEVEEYIKRCLEQSMVRGIKLIGEQGGSIFQYQKGTTPLSSHTSLNVGGRNIYKGIRAGDTQPGKSCVPTHSAAVYNKENCPFLSFPFRFPNGPTLSFVKEWPVGPPIDWKQKLRFFNKFTLPSMYPERDKFTDMTATFEYARGARGTFVHLDLKSFVEYDILNCTRNMREAFENVDMQFDELGPIRVEPTISDSSVDMTMHYPLRVTHNGKSLFELEEFFVSSRIRLKKVYEFAWEILETEANNFAYDIRNQPAPAGMSLTWAPIDDKHYSISIEDSRSFVPEGLSFVPFTFTSVIEKSQPAISYIHYTDLNSVRNLMTNIRNCPQYPSERDNPFESTTRNLTVEIGTTLTRKSIECLWEAYRMSLHEPAWQWAYDPDAQDSLNWTFKTAGCEWNKPCTYRDGNLTWDGVEFQPTYIALNVTDGTYWDFMNMTVYMYDHPPSIDELLTSQVDVEDMLDEIMPDWMTVVGGGVADIAGIKMAMVTAIDEDIYYGNDLDDLTIELAPGVPNYKTKEPTEFDTDFRKSWAIAWVGQYSPFDFTFTVKDKYNKEVTHTIRIT